MKNINKNTILVISLILIIVAGVGGFYAGLQYQKSKSLHTTGGQFGNRMYQGSGQQFFRRDGTNLTRFTPVRGEVIDMENNTFTVKLPDGSSKIIVLGSSTVFVKSQKANISDLKTGVNVMVIGANNADGSVTASDVSINPQQLRPTGPIPQNN